MLLAVLLAALPVAAAPAARSTAPACSFAGGFEDGFADVTGVNPHEEATDCTVYWQLTTGLRQGMYAPGAGVTRGQMASFLARFVIRSGGHLPADPPDAFPDDDGTTHEASIDRLAAVGIAGGRADGTFAPGGPVYRNQMASFLVRALEHRLGRAVADGSPDHFTDDDGDAHETSIDAAASVGVATGTGGTEFGPQRRVRRDQMASFLARSLALLVDEGAAAIPAPPPACVYDSSLARTASSCRPCPDDPSVGITNAACRPSTPPPLGSPASRQTPDAPQIWDNSDPGVLVDGSHVYLFGSTNNVRVPVRPVHDFDTILETSKSAWDRGPRDAMPTRPPWVDVGEADIWAPSVIRIADRYVMYFAGRHGGATTDEHNDQCIGRAMATVATGPYTPEQSPLYCGLPPEGPSSGMPASNRFGRGALDPEVLRGADGRLYLLVALSRTSQNIGVLTLHGDGTVPGGPNAAPMVLQVQQYPWHDGTDDSTLQHGFLENPSMVFEPGTSTYLLFYSAGRWDSEAYNTGFSRCATPTGPCRHDSTGPFLKSGPTRTGPGGLTAFRDPAGVLRAAYSTWARGHERPADNPDGRYSRQGHWATLRVTGTTDAGAQAVSLG